VLEEESDPEYLPGKDIHPQDRWEGDEEKLPRLENEGSMESDEEDIGDNDEEFDAELQDEAALLTFAETLQQAHDAAAAIQRQQEASHKQRKYYTGNSSCTKERWAAKQHGLQVARKKVFISDFFKKKKITPEEATYIGCKDVEEAVGQTSTPIQVYSGLIEPEQVSRRSFC